MHARIFLVSSLLLAAVSGAATASRASAQSDAGSDAEARRYFEEGRVAYDAGQFDAAVRGFRRAYLLSPRPGLLYNIGQAELRAGHDALALEALEGFLRQAPPEDGRRGEVEERVRVLRSMGVRPASEAEAQAAQQDANASPVSTTEHGAQGTDGEARRTDAPSEGGPGVAPWIVAVAGGAALVAGAVLMGVAAGEAGRVTNAADDARWPELRGVAEGAQTLWGVGIALLGVGAGALGVGLVWGLVPSERSQPAQARLRLAPGSLLLEGEF
jgi:tetratricopeptide (TPR) repeat protein